MSRLDIIVISTGPAGSVAGRAAAGCFNVIVVEAEPGGVSAGRACLGVLPDLVSACPARKGAWPKR